MLDHYECYQRNRCTFRDTNFANDEIFGSSASFARQFQVHRRTFQWEKQFALKIDVNFRFANLSPSQNK